MTSILCPVFGGLGNQMFQVAHGISLAAANGLTAEFVDLTFSSGRVRRSWELSCFGVTPAPAGKVKASLLSGRAFLSRCFRQMSTSLEFGVLSEQSVIEHPYLRRRYSMCWGYWQGERFFASSSSLVRKTFSFPRVEADNVPEIVKSECTVAVHVRRGDYVSDPVASAYHLVCDKAWYDRAMNVLRKKLSRPRFYVFSDDHSWAEMAFGSASDVTVVGGNPDAPAWLDMSLMSGCSHYIISNSSYSWWASYLGKTPASIIIAPKFWFPNVATNILDVMCDDWELL